MTDRVKLGMVVAKAIIDPNTDTVDAATKALIRAGEEDFEQAMVALRETYPKKLDLIEQYEAEIRAARAGRHVLS